VAGAAAFILKSSGLEELEFAIRAVLKEEAYITPRIAKQMVSDHVTRDSRAARVARLTPRQRQTLQLVAAGKTSKEIAISLKVATKTIEKHRTDLMQRLGVSNATELVRYAVDHDLV